MRNRETTDTSSILTAIDSDDTKASRGAQTWSHQDDRVRSLGGSSSRTTDMSQGRTVTGSYALRSILTFLIIVPELANKIGRKSTCQQPSSHHQFFAAERGFLFSSYLPLNQPKIPCICKYIYAHVPSPKRRQQRCTPHLDSSLGRRASSRKFPPQILLLAIQQHAIRGRRMDHRATLTIERRAR